MPDAPAKTPPLRAITHVCAAAILSFGIFLPVLLCLIIRRILRGKAIRSKVEILFPDGQPHVLHLFNTANPVIAATALLPRACAASLPLCGVSRHIPEKSSPDPRTAAFTPGVFSLWMLRQANGITFDGQSAADLEYLEKASIRYDLVLVMKLLLTLPLHTTQSQSGHSTLLGISFINSSMREVLDGLEKDLSAGQRRKIFFINPHCLNIAHRNDQYRAALNRADRILPDGSGIRLACALTRQHMGENINGPDMLPYLCSMAQLNNFSISLLGAAPGVAQLMADKLRQSYPKLRISGIRDGYFDREHESERLTAEIAAEKPDLLLVALGVPAQELWIDKYASALNATLIFGVGGLFDFYSGRIRRAPLWMRECGLEWIFRLMMEPRRMFRRYIIGNPLFIIRVLRQPRP